MISFNGLPLSVGDRVIYSSDSSLGGAGELDWATVIDVERFVKLDCDRFGFVVTVGSQVVKLPL